MNNWGKGGITDEIKLIKLSDWYMQIHYTINIYFCIFIKSKHYHQETVGINRYLSPPLPQDLPDTVEMTLDTSLSSENP